MSITSDLTRQHRFDSKVIPAPSGCWEWSGTHTTYGYGMFMWEARPHTRTTAHRASYRLYIGEIPDGCEVHHRCRNRGCVNPEHLEAITPQENRRVRHHAVGPRTHYGSHDSCIHGHPFSGENLKITPDGRRSCRTCGRERMRRFRAERQNVSPRPPKV